MNIDTFHNTISNKVGVGRVWSGSVSIGRSQSGPVGLSRARSLVRCLIRSDPAGFRGGGDWAPIWAAISF